MFISAADELADKTLTFWRISQARNNRSKEEIPMQMALEVLGDSIHSSNPFRPLVKQAKGLIDELIIDEPRRLNEKVSPPTPLRKTI